jgi:hypothetical protein
MYKIFCLPLILLGYVVFGQTGPGGVGSSTSNILWLKADAITGLVDGNNVTTWLDGSGNGKDLSQGSALSQPTYKTSQVNGYPAVYFFGTSGGNYCRLVRNPFTGFSTSAITAFVVDKNNGESNDAILSYASTASDNDFLFFNSSNLSFYRSSNITSSVASNDNSFHVIGSRWRNSDGAVKVHKDGTQNYSGTVSSGTNITSGGSLVLAQEQDAVDGGYDVTQDHQGYMSEVILYNSYLNDAQMIIVQNYLSSKYSLTMASNDKYSYESTGHSYDLAGIGRIDASNIQNDSKSGGIMQLNTFSGLGDGEYLLFAHDNASLGWSSAETPGGDVTNIRRISREWRFAETGDVGTCTVTLDSTLFSARPTSFSQYIVMVDADGDFSSGATSYPMSYVSGTKFQATGVTVADGYYISFAVVRPVIQFTLSNSAAFETSGSANVQVSLNYALTTNATVSYSVSGSSTATGGGTDYTLASGTATIAAGSTTTNMSITLINDVVVESDETVIINLSAPSAGVTLGATSTHTFYIHDDDNARKIDFSVASTSGSESTTTVNLTIQTNSSDPANPTTVDYSVSGGTATGGGIDYTLASGTATVVASPTITTTTLSFIVINDLIHESNETISITLTNPTNANLGTNNVITYTINDDDVAPTISFVQSSSSGSESSSPAAITIMLSAISGIPITVDYAASGGTATAGGVDYTLANGTATIGAGSTTGTINPIIINDAITEVDETFNITLSNPVNSTLGATTVHTYTIMDNDNDGFVGPGGVGNSSNNILWLRADDITGLADGASVATWADTSGNDYDLTQATAASKPLYKTSIVNSKPVIRFDGNDDYLGKLSFTGFATTEISTFVVDKNSDSNDGMMTYASTSSDNDFLLFNSANEVVYRGGSNVATGIAVNGGVFNISASRWRGSDGDVKFHKNGTQSYTGTLASGTSITAGGSFMLAQEQDNVGGGLDATQAQAGDYAEVAVFKKRLNDAQMIIVQNYLAAKYNITLASNNKYVYAATHANEVAGIGRFDASNMHLAAQSAKILEISNPSSPDDGDYFLFGHDNASISSWTSTDAPTASGTMRLAREWRFDNTGTTMGTVKVTIDTTKFPARSAGYNGFVLMVDADGIFASGATLYALTSVGGSLYEANGVTINDNDYVGIAIAQNVTKQDGNFNDVNTWLVGIVPSSTQAVTILNTHDVTLTTNQTIGSASISAGGSLNLSSYTLTVNNGSISNSGTFTASTGTVNYAQSGAQSIEPLTYYNLITSGSGIKTLAGNTTVNGALTIGSGTTLSTSGSNYSLGVGGNWSNSGTFTCNSSTVTFNGSSAQSITNVSLNEIFYDLTIINTSSTGITLNQDITINHSLTLTDGNIYSSSVGMVILIDNATSGLGSSASFVDGPVQKIGDDNFTFPVGKGTQWARLGMTVVSGYAATTKFTCEYFATAGSNNRNSAYMGTNMHHTSSIEYWDLTRTFDTGNDASANVTLYWESNTRSQISVASDLCVGHLSSTTNKWENQGGTIGSVPASGSITSTVPLINFSPISFGSRGGSNALPIELLRFAAQFNTFNKVDLKWTTATEVNNDYFTVERSIDGVNFEKVGITKGAGNSSSTLNYQSVDEHPFMGLSYYRLKQTDFDGKYSYSNIASVEFKNSSVSFIVFPNPAATGEMPYMGFNADETKTILVVVYDASGKEVFSKVSIIEKGDNQIVAIDPSNNLSPGIYIISASSDNSIYKQKLIIR